MFPQEIKALAEKWLAKEQEKIQGENRNGNHIKKRQYIHFDYRIDKISEKIFQETTSPSRVAGHIFFPFIGYFNKTRLFKYNDLLKKRTLEPKDRPIRYASHRDALVFSWYAFLLNFFYEQHLQDLKINNYPIAYRKHVEGEDPKSNTHFFKEVFDFIQTQKECAVICYDIKSFFDSLDHKQIKKKWRSMLPVNWLNSQEGLPADHFTVYKNITKYHYIDRDMILSILKIGKRRLKKMKTICSLKQFKDILKPAKLIHANENKGIPQGAPISSVISNIYMIDFDLAISNYTNEFNGFFRRYSDDIIVVCPVAKIKETEEKIQEEINKLSLTIQTSKTEVNIFTRDDKGSFRCSNQDGKPRHLKYLGFETDGNNIYIKGSTIGRFYRKLSKTIWSAVRRSKKVDYKVIKKRKIYDKFTSLGGNNFLTYAKRASRILPSQETINRQVLEFRVFKFLKKKIKDKTKMAMDKDEAELKNSESNTDQH